MRRTMLLIATTALALLIAGGVAMAATINCPNAANGVCNGTSAGDVMYGSAVVDRMYGVGGADLMYGYGSGDTIYGGNESGLGDKILGGNGNDTIIGQQGNDGLYGGNGNDNIQGQRGNDLIQGDLGQDTLSTGPGSDRVNAQDGQRDNITCTTPALDVVYHDPIDVLVGCRTGLARTQPPPDGLFESKGKVLVKHKGKKALCLPEAALKGHLKHGDDLINPHGCYNPKQRGNS
jgi:hypothetical protein